MDNYIVNLRRELHENPEVAFDLPRTLSILRRELDKIGVEYTEEYGRSSIVATVNPKKSHFTIGVRADIDALPITEKNDITYKSKNDGRMHACGHDAHAAIAMTTLKRIYEMREKIDCRVKFIFQAAEEAAPSGAMLMRNDGVMKDIDCIVALHVDLDFNTGEIGLISGPMNASSDGFAIKFLGKNSHVANQQDGADAIMMAVKAYTEIQFMIAKEIPAREPIIFNIGTINGGSSNNIIAGSCEMCFTLRTWEESTRQRVLSKIDRICRNIAEVSDGDYKLTEQKRYPIVQNSEMLHPLIKRAAEAVVGKDKIKTKIRTMEGEDFSYFANEKPGYMFRLGIRNEEAGIVNSLHTDHFNIDEPAMMLASDVFVRFILDNMGGISQG